MCTHKVSPFHVSYFLTWSLCISSLESVIGAVCWIGQRETVTRMADANGAANGLEVKMKTDKQPYDDTACLYKLGCYVELYVHI